MNEPSLHDISDYNTLDSQKKKVILSVIFSLLIIGVIYTIAYNKYDNKEDTIQVKESLKNIPMR